MKGEELFRRLRDSRGKVVLHGSPFRTKILIPRKCNIVTEQALHRQRGVYGTPYAPIALLYAVIHEDRNDWGWCCDFSKSPDLTLVGPRVLKGGPGYLYVLPKRPFVRTFGRGLCCVAYEPVTPLEVFRVHPTILEYLQEHFSVCNELAAASV